MSEACEIAVRPRLPNVFRRPLIPRQATACCVPGGVLGQIRAGDAWAKQEYIYFLIAGLPRAFKTLVLLNL